MPAPELIAQSKQEPGYLTAEVAAVTPRATNAYNASDLDERDMEQFSLGLDAQVSEEASGQNTGLVKYTG